MQQLQAWLDNTSNSNRVSQLCLNPNCFKSCGCSNAQYEDLMLSCHAVPRLTSLKLWGMRLYYAAPLRSSSANDNSAGGSLTESPSNNINTGGSSPWYDTSIALLPALQELSLSRCVMEMSNIQLLQQATALTSLTIAEIWGQRGQQINLWTWVIEDGQEDTRAATRAELVKTLVSLIQHLPLLQHLSLDISWNDDLEHLYPRDDTPTSLDLSPGLSTLQHLQQLCLPIIASIPSNFAALPDSLTALHLEGVDPLFDPDPVDEYCLSLQTVPQLTEFAALQKLELKWFAVDPTSLPCFTQLRHLSLEHCTTKFMLWPDHHDVFWGGSYSTPLAAALCHLTHLQSLILDTDLAENSVGTAAEWEELLPALTASSQLTKLVLYRRSTPGDSWKESEHLPKQALQHMLPDGRQLPQLKELRLAAVGGSWLSAEQINRLVECCPALECLSLEADKNARFVAAVHTLLPLRATLTSLCLGDCSVVTILWLVTAVVQLTGLRCLVLTGPDEAFPVRSIEQLTELKGLTKLSVASHLCLHNEGDSPDVWRQLQQLCQESPLRLLKLLDGPTSASKLPQETV